MSAQSSIFSVHARSKPGTVTNESPRILRDGRMTITKLWKKCGQQMPHRIGKLVCMLCDLDEPKTTAENSERVGRAVSRSGMRSTRSLVGPTVGTVAVAVTCLRWPTPT